MQKFYKGLFEPLKITLVSRQVVLVDIGNDCHHRLQIQERSITFVRFRNQVVTQPKFCMAGRAIELTADNIGWINITLRQYTSHQTRGGSLTMRTGYRNTPTKSHQFGKHFGTSHNRDA